LHYLDQPVLIGSGKELVETSIGKAGKRQPSAAKHAGPRGRQRRRRGSAAQMLDTTGSIVILRAVDVH